MLKILRHKELTQRIATLTEEIEELRSEKSRLLDSVTARTIPRSVISRKRWQTRNRL